MRLDPIDRAFERIKGYCAKVIGCEKCRFYKDGCCMFQQSDIPPCDWNRRVDHED